MTVNLSTHTATGTQGIYNFANVTGSAYNDLLTGDDNANILIGGPGNDSLAGLGGDDIYRFANGSGNDTVLETATVAMTRWTSVR